MFNRFGGCNKWNINVFVGGKAELASENKFQSWHVAQKKRGEMLELTGSDSRGVWNSPTYLQKVCMYTHVHICVYLLSRHLTWQWATTVATGQSSIFCWIVQPVILDCWRTVISNIPVSVFT